MGFYASDVAISARLLRPLVLLVHRRHCRYHFIFLALWRTRHMGGIQFITMTPNEVMRAGYVPGPFGRAVPAASLSFVVRGV